MKKKCKVLIYIFLYFGIHCAKAINEPIQQDNIVSIRNRDNSILIKINRKCLNKNEDQIFIQSVFFDEGFVIKIDSSVVITGLAEVEIYYESKYESNLKGIKEAYLNQFNDFGFINSTEKIAVDTTNKIISFSTDNFSFLFI